MQDTSNFKENSDSPKSSENIWWLTKTQIDYTNWVLKKLLDWNNKKPASKEDISYTKDKMYKLVSNLVKKVSDPSVMNKWNLAEWNIVDDFTKWTKSWVLNTLFHLSQNPDRNNQLDKALSWLKKPDWTLNYAKLQNEIWSYIDWLNQKKIQSRVDSLVTEQVADDLNATLDSLNAAYDPTIKQATRTNAPTSWLNQPKSDPNVQSWDPEFLALKTNQEKIDYLNKLFDWKTCFDLPDKYSYQFLTNVWKLWNTRLNWPKVYLSWPVQTKTIDWKLAIKVKVRNVTFNEWSNNAAQWFEINLWDINEVWKAAKEWKNSPNNSPYSQIEVWEYNSNKVYNQMLAIINMMEWQVNWWKSWKAGEKLSYIDFFWARDILNNGWTLPWYVTKLWKAWDNVWTENGGWLCASANTLYRTLSLGAKTWTVNEYQFNYDKDWVAHPTRNPKQVALWSSAPAVFSWLNFSDHSSHYYFVRQDNPIVWEGKNYDSTVFVWDTPAQSADLKAINSSWKDMYVHMKITILDSWKPTPNTSMGAEKQWLHDNSTTWFNETYIDDKKPTQAELNHTKQQFANFLSFRPRLPKPTIFSLPAPNAK